MSTSGRDARRNPDVFLHITDLLRRLRESERYTHFDIIIIPRDLTPRFRASSPI